MSTEKKVLFVATVASHIKAFHIPFLKLFKDKNYKTYVAANWNLDKDEKLEYCDKFVQIPIQRSPYSLKNTTAIKELKAVIEKEKFDIIHCHTPMGSVVARLAAKKARKEYGTRVIYTAHGFHFYKGAPIKNWLLFYPVEWYLAKYTDTLITINTEDFELAKTKFRKRCKNIEYVQGVGIDKRKFDSLEDKNIVRKKLNLEMSDFVMIYPAEISNRKRQMWLIKSISSLLKKYKNMHLLLPGKDSLGGKCLDLCKELEIEGQVHFLGYRNDIPDLLNISDLSVSSSRQEGLPVNIMEAMYMEKPIVATNCRGNRDLVQDGENGYLIEIDEGEKLAEAIKNVYYNKEKIEFGKKSKEIIKNYLLDSIIKEMENIYYR